MYVGSEYIIPSCTCKYVYHYLRMKALHGTRIDLILEQQLPERVERAHISISSLFPMERLTWLTNAINLLIDTDGCVPSRRTTRYKFVLAMSDETTREHRRELTATCPLLGRRNRITNEFDGDIRMYYEASYDDWMN